MSTTTLVEPLTNVQPFQPNPRLYVFDLDDTLIAGYVGRDDRDFNHLEILSGRADRLRRLRYLGHHIGIATNQGGVAFGHVTALQVWDKLNRVADALHIERRLIAVSFGHPSGTIAQYSTPSACARRKPAGEMTRELMDIARVEPGDTMFIGDRPEDEREAEKAGVRFMWADEFFS